MIKALIIEDELSAREELLLALDKYDDIAVADQCGDLFTAMKQIRQHKPDVIFLDICLPGHDYDVPLEKGEWPEHGFTLLDYMESDEHQPSIVIVSAYSEYTLRAFEANVLDYMQKPVLDERLEKTMGRIRAHCASSDSQPLPYPDRALERIPCYSNNRVRFIKVNDIEYVESRGEAGVHVVCAENAYYTELTLKTLAQKTPLIQTHRQYLVSLDAVLEYARLPDTDRSVLFTVSNKEVPVSRKYKKMVKQLLGLQQDDDEDKDE